MSSSRGATGACRNEGRADVGTLCSLSAVAFVAACFAHETLGHGTACTATGGRVTLPTSVITSFEPENSQMFVDEDRLSQLGLTLGDLARFLEAQPFVLAVFTSDDVRRAAEALPPGPTLRSERKPS